MPQITVVSVLPCYVPHGSDEVQAGAEAALEAPRALRLENELSADTKDSIAIGRVFSEVQPSLSPTQLEREEAVSNLAMDGCACLTTVINAGYLSVLFLCNAPLCIEFCTLLFLFFVIDFALRQSRKMCVAVAEGTVLFLGLLGIVLCAVRGSEYDLLYYLTLLKCPFDAWRLLTSKVLRVRGAVSAEPEGQV
eukprot:TRINITY_DN47132_c0_g1_i1.p1 TRINITY_DN47132_c0_g1~~TRINITY_DN47132_c0_g1_i1.p1  ORF type:complete len:193 (-),score=29.39 TRINITY_DN47132_c0_g1_i1:276-854(-)